MTLTNVLRRLNTADTTMHRSFGVLGAVLLLMLSGGCTTSTNYVSKSSRSMQRLDKLVIEVDMAPEIDFVGSRQKGFGWPEMVFGLLGRRVEVAVHDNADREVAEQINTGAEMDAAEVLSGRLKEDFVNSGRVGSVAVYKKGRSPGVLDTTASQLSVTVPSWGIKRFGEEGKLKTFLDASLQFTPRPGSPTPIVDQQVVSFDAANSLEDYKNNKELLRRDMYAVMTEASKRIVEVVLQ